MQQAASQCLADLKPGPAQIPQVLPKIVQAIGSEDPAVQQSALDAIDSVLAGADPGLLLTGTLKIKATRPLGALAVQRIGPRAKSAVPALADALKDDRAEVRRDVALAIAAIGPAAEATVAGLIESLGDDDGDVRRASAYALGRIGPAAKSAQAALRNVVAGSDAAARPVAAWALAFIAPGDAATAKVVLPHLVRGLESAREEERQEAARALGQLRGSAASALGALKQAAQDPDTAVRAAAQAAVTQIEAAGT